MSHLAAKFLLVPFPLVLLAACEQKNETSAANATLIATPRPSATASAPTATAYDCRPMLKLSAAYDNSGATPKVQLTIGEKMYELTEVIAASGAKYATDRGRAPGKTLVWWTKGRDGTLYEGKVGGTDVDEKEISSCSERKG